MTSTQAGKMTAWETAKKCNKTGFDAAWDLFEKLGRPINKFTNKIGSEAFWPSSLDKESEKAARILKSFCEDGFYTEKKEEKDQPPPYNGPNQSERPNQSDGPKQKARVLVKIPQSVIQNCVGLAIFSTFRTGLHVSGAGGSGVLIARLLDGSWSPPSGILIHTLGIGFNAGIDIYDCVVVINNAKALEAFSKLRVTLGAGVSVAAGPVGVGGNLDCDIEPGKEKDRTPVFTYMKSRGLYAGAQIEGTFIVERSDENARFYGERLPVTEILAGRVKNVPAGTRPLIEMAKMVDGRTFFEENIVHEVNSYSAPVDVEAEKKMEAAEKQRPTCDATNATPGGAEFEKEMEATGGAMRYE